MPSIRKQVHIDAPVAKVWEALRDVGALHTRLVPGFVWTVDLLPNEMAEKVDAMMSGGIEVIKKTLERTGKS